MISKQAFELKKDGSPKKLCICRTPWLIENYEEAISDITQIWICHHRNEKFYSSKELIELGLYYDCPPCELIFLTIEEHGKQYHKGRRLTEEQKRHLSEINKGKTAWNKGIPATEEAKRKNAEAHKGKQTWLGKHHSEKSKQKIKENHKGMSGKKHSEETKRKISETLKMRNTL